jgi:hypothetical protein
MIAPGGSHLETFMLGDELERPLYPLAADGTAGRRDPRPEWDAWYCLSLAERRQLVRFMAPAGQGGIGIDDLVSLVPGAGSIDDALAAWSGACHLVRSSSKADLLDLDDWRDANAQAEADAELYGPAELAARWGISVPALHQRRHRGQCPTEDLTLSRVPIWSGETIRVWEEGAA